LNDNYPHQQQQLAGDHTQQQQQHRMWSKPPRVLSLEGLNPLVLGGQWLPDVKAAAGAVDASGQQPGDNPARITWQQVGWLVTCLKSAFQGGQRSPDVGHLASAVVREHWCCVEGTICTAATVAWQQWVLLMHWGSSQATAQHASHGSRWARLSPGSVCLLWFNLSHINVLPGDHRST
jgi:hypothetical protein